MNKRKLASLEITNNKAYIFPVMSFIDAIAVRHTSIDVSRYNQMRLVIGEILKQRIEKSYPGSCGEIFVLLPGTIGPNRYGEDPKNEYIQ